MTNTYQLKSLKEENMFINKKHSTNERKSQQKNIQIKQRDFHQKRTFRQEGENYQFTSYKQHTLIILFLSSSQTTPPFPLRLPTFYVPTCTQSAHQASRHIASQTSMLQDAGLHPPFNGRQVLSTPAILLMVGRCCPPQPSFLW